jgi:hypothetical protein
METIQSTKPSYLEILATVNSNESHPFDSDSLSGSNEQVPEYSSEQIEQARQRMLTKANQEKQRTLASSNTEFNPKISRKNVLRNLREKLNS